MRIRLHIIYIFLLFVGCNYSTTYEIDKYENSIIEILSEEDSLIKSIIQPYKDSIENEMNEIITYTKTNLKKNKPQGTLGNFVTDLCLNYAEADLCFMNNGGLRTSIDIGNVTVRKIYELMPFENELVIINLNKKDFLLMVNYIIEKGGEPFSGIKIKTNSKKEILDLVTNIDFNQNKMIRVLTSDYLGNSREFFKGKEQEIIGIKLRDAIIDYCSRIDSIDVQLDDRFQIIKNEK